MSNRTIWIFGDSFSTPFEHNTLGIWCNDYIKWKGYSPKTFGDILSTELDLPVKHLAVGGIGNDSIFEIIQKHAPLIQKEDIVIIGWSSVLRYRLAVSNNTFTTIIPNYLNYNKAINELDFISNNTLDELIVNRELLIWKEELYNRVKFLNWLFEDMVLIQWTPFKYGDIKINGFSNVHTIKIDTNGKIDDAHYSEQGHQFIASKFKEFIFNDELRIRMNTLHTKYV
jgi:hypothetical protein